MKIRPVIAFVLRCVCVLVWCVCVVCVCVCMVCVCVYEVCMCGVCACVLCVCVVCVCGVWCMCVVCVWGVWSFNDDRRTGRHEEANSRFSHFCERNEKRSIRLAEHMARKAEKALRNCTWNFLT